MKIGDKYNWKNQPERLVYLGKKGSWHQFAKTDRPYVVWCEVLTEDLHLLEETKDEAPTSHAPAGMDVVWSASDETRLDKALESHYGQEPVARPEVIKHIENAIAEHCRGGDLWLCAMLAAEQVDGFYAATSRAQPAQKPLFKELIDQNPGLDAELKAAGDGFDLGFEAGRRLAAPQPSNATDSFDKLVAEAKAEAAKAMLKFPQPNYVISKFAEEAGEVVKDAIHAAEGRQTLANLRGEMRQAMAMLYRLWIEGDQVHRLPPVGAGAYDEGHLLNLPLPNLTEALQQKCSD